MGRRVEESCPSLRSQFISYGAPSGRKGDLPPVLDLAIGPIGVLTPANAMTFTLPPAPKSTRREYSTFAVCAQHQLQPGPLQTQQLTLSPHPFLSSSSFFLALSARTPCPAAAEVRASFVFAAAC